MKVICVTAFTPTPENRGGISALLYHLLEARNMGIKVKVLTFNLNKIPKDEINIIASLLSIEMEIAPIHQLYKIISANRILKLAYLVLSKFSIESKLVLNKNGINSIKKYKPDFIWLYPYFPFKIMKKLQDFRFVISEVDCVSLVNERFASNPFWANSFLRDLRLFFAKRQAINAEKSFSKTNALIHYVGLADAKCYKMAYRVENAFFMLHPHYALKNKVIQFSENKLKVLIAGKNDHYVYSDLYYMLKGFINHKKYSYCLDLTFLGKGWENEASLLNKNGYVCKQIEWVDDYIEEIIKYDIQLTPISVGSGTKGKVLDALANGLLVVGSKYAFENIAVRDGESCILYKDPENIVSILYSIFMNKPKYEAVAEKGRQQVRTYHNPKRISNRFFNYISSCISDVDK